MRIMVAIDFSDGSDRALAQAISLACKLGAELDLVHVTPVPYGPPAGLVSMEPMAIPTFDDDRKRLADAKAFAEKNGVKTQTHLEVGQVTFGLLDTISRIKPDCVVVGSHGKGPLARALLGSVSETLARRANVPVMIVPSPRRAWAADRAAWCCAACGHILGEREATERCQQCGADPAKWISAPITSEPIDAGEPASSDAAPASSAGGGSSPSGLFSTSPGGTEGYSVNPELRIRY